MQNCFIYAIFCNGNTTRYYAVYKVDVSNSDTFLPAPAISACQAANPYHTLSHLLHNIESSYEHLIHYQSEDSRAH